MKGKKLNYGGSKGCPTRVAHTRGRSAHTRSFGAGIVSQYTKLEIRPGFGHFPGGESRPRQKIDPDMAHLAGRSPILATSPGSTSTQDRF